MEVKELLILVVHSSRVFMPRTHVDKVARDLYILRLDDDETKYFEALWYIPEGVTYNAYVLVTDEGAVLFDSWKHTYSELFIDTLRGVVDPKDIKYVVIHHMEPDHSGSIPRLLETCRCEPTVLGHPLVNNMLRSFYGVEARFTPVKDLEEMPVAGRSLKFIHIPWLHWPDTIATYIADSKVLLTCDAFGGFGIPPTIYDDNTATVEWYLPHVRKYVATVVGHYREHIAKNVDKISRLNLEVRTVAPAHGLVWRHDPKVIIDIYYRLSRAEPAGKKVVVIYDTMYGFVEQAVKVVAEELSRQGYEVKIFSFTDRGHAQVSDIVGESLDSYAMVLGLSTYEGKLFPQMEYVVRLLVDKVDAEKPVLLVTSYGWGKVAEEYLRNLLRGSRLKVVDIVHVRGAPGGEDVERLRQATGKLL